MYPVYSVRDVPGCAHDPVCGAAHLTLALRGPLPLPPEGRRGALSPGSHARAGTLRLKSPYSRTELNSPDSPALAGRGAFPRVTGRFIRAQEGGFIVNFPNLPNGWSQGENRDAALAQAEDLRGIRPFIDIVCPVPVR
jgi:hypothetical protein